MLTRQWTPGLWDPLQSTLGTCPMFGSICTVYDCLGLQVAERRQTLDLCFPLSKFTIREPLAFTHFIPVLDFLFFFTLQLFPFRRDSFMNFSRWCVWAQTDMSHLIRSNGVWQIDKTQWHKQLSFSVCFFLRENLNWTQNANLTGVIRMHILKQHYPCNCWNENQQSTIFFQKLHVLFSNISADILCLYRLSLFCM